ncbi:RNA-binding transcriptional accessory protein [Enterococcus italicus]|uniref:Tex family protein n=1 Tax=Enterococcus italicus TaxID=246144 RepID=UPI002072DC09|nr:Tex family protein [Enterococcus italicus]MCM6931296.1 RNA-binding transcriptional accessory protein [Enterococcus italicus]
MTMTNHEEVIIKALGQYKPKQIRAVLNLLADGNTVPFIARYRKEMTGSLDEVQIKEIEDRATYIDNLEKRRQEILTKIESLDQLSSPLKQAIEQVDTLQLLEDYYRPFKQKRRTKATIAKENGLEPFAKWLKTFPNKPSLEEKASQFLNDAILSIEDALSGVHEILAEEIGDNAEIRKWIRSYTMKHGKFYSRVKDEEADEKRIYEMYYDFSEPYLKMVSHRILAANRGEKEGVLKAGITVDEGAIFLYLERTILKGKQSNINQVLIDAAIDAYKRFIQPAIERDLRSELTTKADEQAIQVFGENLRNLLLQAPLKGKVVMGFDPAYRTGCKLAIIDATGAVLAIDVIYPHAPAPAAKRQASGEQFRQLIQDYKVEMVAIGNGTASRESEQFVAEQLKLVDTEVYYVIVSEAGASVYSASPVAREEFPKLQVEQRSAISIGRRLQDPLAELVKIEPKAVGVGQYQHDVSQKRLADELSFVVETAVNQVGVDVNTASAQLLGYVSGINKTTAQNIVTLRQEVGSFTERKELKKVPRLGPKAYEQAIGFLRIPKGKSIFDSTSIHPESYPLAKKILEYIHMPESSVGSEETTALLKQVSQEKLADQWGIAVVTLQDIIQGLIQPGRDMRDAMPAPLLRKDVLTITDLSAGMELKGTVRNVVDFGAFVDIGVKHDGLVHVSKLSEKFVKKASEIVAVGDIVSVWVEQVDLARERVSLTMIQPRQAAKV